MFIIVGLGNPEKKYENTRHNIGFAVIDQLAREEHIPVLEKKHRALIGKGYIGGEKVILAKPQTYMNLSGESVRELVDYYKIDETKELLVISDDITLPAGQLRLRKKGSAGGHNGLKNIILHLGHDNFMRLKMGVGERPGGGRPENRDLIEYVLAHFTEQEKQEMEREAGEGADAVRMVMKDGIEAAMNCFNKKAAARPDEG